MEELKRLEQTQTLLSLMKSRGLLTSDHDSNRFLANLVFLLVQPCGELNMDKRCFLVTEFMPIISSAFLEEVSSCIRQEEEPELEMKQTGSSVNYIESDIPRKADHESLRSNYDDMAMVGFDAMQRANSTLEDFCRSYFMFHGIDINYPLSTFKYLPVLSFTESYIYQLDGLNEKIVQATASSFSGTERERETWLDKNKRRTITFKADAFRPLASLLKSKGLLTKRISQEFRFGEEYWMLERKLCCALANKEEISVEDVMRAIHLKSFDYRVLNLLLYQLRGEKVNDLHMEFLSVSEFLVEVSDDLFDYEEDVLENTFNILRMFVGIFGSSKAPAMLAKYITEGEQKYENLLKTLDPQMSSNYQRRCQEATKEGGKISGHPFGTWNIPPIIGDEELYRSQHSQDT